jgi:hypothetical protein
MRYGIRVFNTSKSFRTLSVLSALALASLGTSAKEWPFYKPVQVEPPKVKAVDRVANPIDSFVLARLEEKKLTLAPEASKRTLVRRLYFDLIGLPPTPEQVEAFVSEADPQAYETLVDDLLKDPRHGERWARFWLDLARYADTAGYEGDPDMPHAWRYRDYVIDSLNRDKPYDQFIKEQIAGDEYSEIMGAGELPLPDAEKVVAMTFLRLAPFTEPRGDETRHEMLSEITTTVSSVFLGLTVGCAKCHDHKYDQIPIKDFYRMKAFFNTVQIMPPERGDGFQIGGPLPAEFYRDGEKDWAAKKREEIEKIPEELENLQRQFRERAGTEALGAGFGLQSMASGNDYIYDKRGINDGTLHAAVAASDGSKWTFSTDGKAADSTGSKSGGNKGDWFGDLANANHVSIGQHTEGTGEPKGSGHRGAFAEVILYDHPLTEKERTQLSRYTAHKYHGKAFKAVPQPPQIGMHFWLDAADLDADPSTPNPEPETAIAEWVDKVGGIVLRQNDTSKQPKVYVFEKTGAQALHFDGDLLLGGAAEAEFLKDQQGTIVVVLSVEHEGEGYGFEVGGKGGFMSTFVNPSAEKDGFDVEPWVNNPDNSTITTEERERYHQLKRAAPFVSQQLKRLKPIAMSLRHSFGPPYEPGVPTSRVMLRGQYDNPGEVVEAGFLSCISGNQEPAKIRLDPFKRWPTRSRRMALAQWIASPDNPLTARVMVNRLWYRHFGRGIVETPSDFGKLSGGPSHQALLDWLAIQFVKDGWSLKKMHRLMVTSSTYRQSSQREDVAASKADPDNKLLWRFNRRRLEAEAVRDSVLVVSGRLNSERFGLPIFPPLPDDIAERVKYSTSKWATDTGPGGRKRSLYIYQQRTLNMPFMQTFDGLVCEDSIPRRRASVTPLQALAMYNGDFVNDEANHFANRLKEEAGDAPETRVRHAFQIALSRAATPNEIDQLRPFAADDGKLPGLCRILFNTNEFVYID